MSQAQTETAEVAAPTTLRGLRTRDAVRDAAAATFAELGYDDATASEIARRAGVSEATVFGYFGSKPGLLLAVMERFYELLLDETSEAACAPGDAAERFRHLVDRWAARVERDWDLIVVFGQRARFGPETDLGRRFTQLNREFTRAHLEVLAELAAEERLAADLPLTLARDLLFGTLEHTGLGQAAAGRPVELRATARRLVDLLVAPTPPSLTARLDRIETALEELRDPR